MTAAAPRAVILNDTTASHHHGCARVMRVLRDGLAAAGIIEIAASPVRHDWRADVRLMEAIARAGLVVINGEGTLHHGRPAGLALLKVVEAVAPQGTPVALVNALWQDNPSEWGPLAARLALIRARDSRSAEALTKATGRPVAAMPDLSLCAGAAHPAEPGRGIVFGDAVRLSTRRVLARAALRHRGALYLPIKAPPRLVSLPRPLLATALRAGFSLYNGIVAPHPAPTRLAASEAEYLDILGAHALHVTGRFHGVALSLVAGVPFLAVASNSWKIEALVADAGLDPARVVAPEALAATLKARPHAADWAWSPAEHAAVAGVLERGRRQAAQLFSELRALAGAPA